MSVHVSVLGLTTLLLLVSLSGPVSGQVGTPVVFAREQYPDPRTNWPACRRPFNSSVCDPGGYLTRQQADDLERMIQDIQRNSGRPCGVSSSQPYVVMIAIVPKVQSRRGSTQSTVGALGDFIQYLQLVSWRRYQTCGEEIFIVYHGEDDLVGVVSGSTAARLITPECTCQILYEARVALYRNSNTPIAPRRTRDIMEKLRNVLLRREACLPPPNQIQWQRDGLTGLCTWDQGSPRPNPTPLPTPRPTQSPTPGPSPIPLPGPTPVPRPGPTQSPPFDPTFMPPPFPPSGPSPIPLPGPSPVPPPGPTPLPPFDPTFIPPSGPSPIPLPGPSPVPPPGPTQLPPFDPTFIPPSGPSPIPLPGPSPVPPPGPTQLPPFDPTFIPPPGPTPVPPPGPPNPGSPTPATPTPPSQTPTPPSQTPTPPSQTPTPPSQTPVPSTPVPPTTTPAVVTQLPATPQPPSRPPGAPPGPPVNVDINEISPLVSESSGSITLTISGVNINNIQQVKVGPLDCDITVRRTDQLECMLVSLTDAFINSELPVSIVLSTSQVVPTGRFFVYAKPVVQNVKPLTTTISGGLPLTVAGLHFNLVQRADMVTMVTTKQDRDTVTYRTECSIESSTIILCPTPRIILNNIMSSSRRRRSIQHRERWRRQASDSRTVVAGLDVNSQILLDNQPAELARYDLNVHRDPRVFPFEQTERSWTGTDTTLEMRGEGLLPIMSDHQIQPQIGTEKCDVTELFANMLLCKPPDEPPGGTYNVRIRVEVNIGNLRFDIGFLKYVNDFLIWIGVSVGIIALLLIILLITLYCCLRRRKARRSD